MLKEELLKVKRAVHQLEIENIATIIRECLEAGIEPLKIIREGITQGLDQVGEDFEAGTYFLGELMLAGQVASEGMVLLEKELPKHQIGEKGKIVLATVEGDIHEIGKNILAMLLKAGGFEVIDLGVDVPARSVLNAVKESGARLVGLSLLFSSVTSSLKETVQLINNSEEGEVKILIGGACTSQQLRQEICAHGYAESAVQGVKIFQQWAANPGKPWWN